MVPGLWDETFVVPSNIVGLDQSNLLSLSSVLKERTFLENFQEARASNISVEDSKFCDLFDTGYLPISQRVYLMPVVDLFLT
jgi:hypothetical protein